MQPPPTTVSRIEISELFGQFNYNIDLSRGSPAILYGDNGSGKTTILNLIVHLLGPEPWQGHRTYIGRVRFKDALIVLSDETAVFAYRDAATDGPYTLSVNKPGDPNFTYKWFEDSHTAPVPKPEYAAVFGALKRARAVTHFLPDTRRAFELAKNKEKLQRLVDGTVRRVITTEPDEDWLKTVMKNTLQSLRSATVTGTNRAIENTNAIYSKILSRLSSFGDETNAHDGGELRSNIVNRLGSLRAQNSLFDAYGLTAPLDIDAIVNSVMSIPAAQLSLANHILSPYLDGIEARLNALFDTQRLMSTFSEVMSSFYHGKSVRMHLTDGVTITTSAGDPLDPNHLSSGEKQLMLLMCHTINARLRATVFAIDEPELSLNIKWQRQLVNALLLCLEGSGCQLILATHSIELLAQYDVLDLGKLSKKKET